MVAVTVGVWALRLAVVAGVAAVVTVRRPRIAIAALGVAAAGTTVATVVLAEAFWSKDFSLAYVVDHTRRAADGPTRVSGIWGGMGGSLLVFAVGTALVGLLASVRCPAPLRGRVAGLTGAVTACLTACVALLSDPFERLAVPAVDGLGLTPILEHPAMLYHPPIVYAGLTSLTGAAAITVAALSVDQLDEVWARQVRRWLLVPWVLLAVGMLAGAHWAYVELGWGGYWAWDPVENTALLPWLAATAALHGLRPAVTGRAARLSTVAALTGGAYLLALLGGLLTRSGATESVHAFAEEPAIGRAFTGLLVAACLGFAGLLLRHHRHTARAETPTDPRARALRVQMGLIVGALAVVLLGSTWPLLRDLAGARPVSVEGTFFADLLGPVAVALLIGMAVGPSLGRRPLGATTLLPVIGAAAGVAMAGVAGWTGWFPMAVAAAGGAAVVGATREIVATRGAVGGHVAHLGAAVLLVGMAGTATGGTQTLALAPGGSAELLGRTVRNGGVEVVAAPDPGTDAVEATITVDGRALHPQLVVHHSRGRLLAESALHSRLAEDVQVMLRDARESGSVVVQVGVHPLQQLVWWGALILVAGGGLALRSEDRRVRRRGRAEAPGARHLYGDAGSREATPGSHPDVVPPPAPPPAVPAGSAPPGPA